LTGSGVFRLFLGLDGRVNSIKVAQSPGDKQLDIKAMKAIR
jgi:outer membrane biosynthesis protein TonB